MPLSPREAPSTVQDSSAPSRARRSERRPPGERSSEIASPDAVSIVTPASPGAFWLADSRQILTSERLARACPRYEPPLWPSDSGRQPSRELIQPQKSTAAASESSRWRTVTDAIAASCERSTFGSKAAAIRSRHGVERSHARSHVRVLREVGGA